MTGGTGPAGLAFWGANAVAANGGNPVWIYSPTSFDDGSSGSHLDDDIPEYDFIMEAFTSTGPGIRTISRVEVGILQDIGYVDAVPEPTSTLVAVMAALVLMNRGRSRIADVIPLRR